jgi:hypothetical protein
MIKAIPLITFEHNGTKKRGAVYEFSDQTAKLLAAKGLVELLPVNVKKNIAESSAVLPAEQALPEQTVTKSETGVSRKRTKTEKS